LVLIVDTNVGWFVWQVLGEFTDNVGYFLHVALSITTVNANEQTGNQLVS
jgi:hypothetical protein